MINKLTIIGGGLAGCEAAWQAVQQGVCVRLHEMRPAKMTAAHRTGYLGELVCSNSLRSKELITGAGLLKLELKKADSLIIKAAEFAEVSAGSALAVDREAFAHFITGCIEQHPSIEVVREEVTAIPEDGISILATGPLTSHAMAEAMQSIIGDHSLYFYDAIAPIVDAESIDRTKIYHASRYDKGGDDYINCPFSKEEYNRFYDFLMDADTAAQKEFEDVRVFEGCMPIEVMAHRGRDTLRYGPLRPVGLRDPRTGRIPHAVVQLRPENKEKTAYNIVGFQTRLRRPEQDRVFRVIPGLEKAEFLRYGSIHRNTFINSPRHLNQDLSLKDRDSLYIAGQITGVEGYIESTAMGLLAGINAARRLSGREAVSPSSISAHGALLRHITESEPMYFQPSNIHFGLIPCEDDEQRIQDKKMRRTRIAELALKAWSRYVSIIRLKEIEEQLYGR